MEELGLEAVTNTVNPYTDENIDKLIEYHVEIGAKGLVLPVVWYETKDDVLRCCENINRWGKKCHEAGLYYLFHNHFHEFQKFDGKTVVDMVLENTDPDYVGFELDTYWAMRAGVDPCESAARPYTRRTTPRAGRTISTCWSLPVQRGYQGTGLWRYASP